MPPTPQLQLDPRLGRITRCLYIPSPNRDRRPRGTTIDTIVIHAISLPPREYHDHRDKHITRLFTNRLDPTAHPYFAQLKNLKVSAHFLIRRNGELIQFVPTHMRAWHAGESAHRDRPAVNDFSLGIELEGSDHDPFTDPQYTRLTDLLLCLTAAYPIPPQNIVGHSDIALPPGRKTDPGTHFNWTRIRTALNTPSPTPPTDPNTPTT